MGRIVALIRKQKSVFETNEGNILKFLKRDCCMSNIVFECGVCVLNVTGTEVEGCQRCGMCGMCGMWNV